MHLYITGHYYLEIPSPLVQSPSNLQIKQFSVEMENTRIHFDIGTTLIPLREVQAPTEGYGNKLLYYWYSAYMKLRAISPDLNK